MRHRPACHQSTHFGILPFGKSAWTWLTRVSTSLRLTRGTRNVVRIDSPAETRSGKTVAQGRRTRRSSRQTAPWSSCVTRGPRQRAALMSGPISSPSPLIPRVASKAASGLLAVLLAPACAVCDVILDEPLLGCVCSSCWASIRPITPPVCDQCGDSLARADASCQNCAGKWSAVSRARAIGEYEGALRDIVHAFKYLWAALAGGATCRQDALTRARSLG